MTDRTTDMMTEADLVRTLAERVMGIDTCRFTDSYLLKACNPLVDAAVAFQLVDALESRFNLHFSMSRDGEMWAVQLHRPGDLSRKSDVRDRDRLRAICRAALEATTK